jgi:hypothetical protein
LKVAELAAPFVNPAIPVPAYVSTIVSVPLEEILRILLFSVSAIYILPEASNTAPCGA